VAVVLRPELGLTSDDEVLVHMGAGAALSLIRAAINNYWAYQGIQDLDGAFTVSVYAAIGGVTEEMIVQSMPHKQYGVATFGVVRTAFDVWPTTHVDADIDPQIKAVHFRRHPAVRGLHVAEGNDDSKPHGTAVSQSERSAFSSG
jgi:hypothetical protein